MTKRKVVILSKDGSVKNTDIDWDYTLQVPDNIAKNKLDSRWCVVAISKHYVWIGHHGDEWYWGKDYPEFRAAVSMLENDQDLPLSNPAVTLGRKGGQSKSAKKVASSAENGKKGGRPPAVIKGKKV